MAKKKADGTSNKENDDSGPSDILGEQEDTDVIF